MKVLLVKTSSMGDLIHTLPALTDAQKAIPDIRFDWVSEEGFAEIPGWHSAVDEVIPVALRRWRNNWLQAIRCGEISAAIKHCRLNEYDYIIDAQSLLKSALITRLARGLRCGPDSQSSREALAALFYQKKIAIPKYTELHAIARLRRLFAKILGYRYDAGNLDYGISGQRFKEYRRQNKYLVFLHGSSREQKLWPLENWLKLAEKAKVQGFDVYLPWGNNTEKQRAEKIAGDLENCHVLAKMRLQELAEVIAQASAVAGVDTGLAHLTAALSIPAVIVYPATDPNLIGACGERQICLAEICNKSALSALPGLNIEYCDRLSVERVWECLERNF